MSRLKDFNFFEGAGLAFGCGAGPGTFFITTKTQIHEVIQTLLSPANRRDSTSARLVETGFAKGGQISRIFCFLSSVIQQGFILKNNFSSTFCAVKRL